MLNILIVPLVILLTLLYYMYIYFSRGKNPHSLPGPKGRFLVGVLFEVKLDSLYENLHEWSIKYGDVFQFNLMGKNFVSLNTAEVLCEAFKKEPNATITAARNPTNFGKNLLGNYSDVSFASPNKNWTKMRKFVHRLLHQYGEGLQNIEEIIWQSLRLLKDEIVTLEGKDQNPAYLIEDFIQNTLEALLIGRTFGRNGDFQPLMRKVDDLGNILANPGWDFMYLHFPFLRSIPLTKSREMDDFLKAQQQLLDLFNKHKENLKEGESGGIFLNMKNMVKENQSLQDPWFTEQNIINVMWNIISAGFLSTRGTLVSIVQLLAKRPDIQRKLQQEIDENVGLGRNPKLSDREKCPFIEAVILETMRYISHIPYGIVHRTTEPCTINGYRIERDTPIIPNFWTILHNAKDWGDPFKFRPERFLDNTGNLLPASSPERKRMLAFGLGKRACIGEVFAKSRMFLFLATLMQTVTIHEPKTENLPDITPTDMLPGLVNQPRPYKIRFVLR